MASSFAAPPFQSSNAACFSRASCRSVTMPSICARGPGGAEAHKRRSHLLHMPLNRAVTHIPASISTHSSNS